MGTYFHTIVFKLDSDADAQSAFDLARNWMIKKEYLDPKLDDSPLVGLGHKPGSNIAEIVYTDGDNFRYLHNMRINGMGAHIGRQVYIGWALLGEFSMACDMCERSSEVRLGDDKIPKGLPSKVDNWINNEGDMTIACPICKSKKRVDEWDYGDTLGFGNLGLTFWNWPQLKQKFLVEVCKIVGAAGKIVSGKI